MSDDLQNELFRSVGVKGDILNDGSFATDVDALPDAPLEEFLESKAEGVEFIFSFSHSAAVLDSFKRTMSLWLIAL